MIFSTLVIKLNRVFEFNPKKGVGTAIKKRQLLLHVKPVAVFTTLLEHIHIDQAHLIEIDQRPNSANKPH